MAWFLIYAICFILSFLLFCRQSLIEDITTTGYLTVGDCIFYAAMSCGGPLSLIVALWVSIPFGDWKFLDKKVWPRDDNHL